MGRSKRLTRTSIDDFGEFALSLGASPVRYSRGPIRGLGRIVSGAVPRFLESTERGIGDSDTARVLSVEVGQVVVVDIDYRIKIGFKAFVVTQVAHALPQAVTDIQLREV